MRVVFQVISDSALQAMRKDFMEAFDENDDDKIEISEARMQLIYNLHQ